MFPGIFASYRWADNARAHARVETDTESHKHSYTDQNQSTSSRVSLTHTLGAQCKYAMICPLIYLLLTCISTHSFIDCQECMLGSGVTVEKERNLYAFVSDDLGNI